MVVLLSTAANLLLQDGRVKICDFGHAKHIGLGGIATPCPTCGTQGYRAPEVCTLLWCLVVIESVTFFSGRL